MPPNETLEGAKPFVKPGSVVTTVRSSVAVPELPAEDVRSPVVLV